MTLRTLTNSLGKVHATPDTVCETPAERRFYPRPKLRFEGTLDAEGQRIPFRGINLHRLGARIVGDQPLPAGTVVFFFATSHNLIGWATVQWGAWRGQKYHMGLEFRNPLMRAEAGDWSFSCVRSPVPTPEAHA
jgi:hypothetical protein